MRIPIHRLPLRGFFAIVTKLPQYIRLAFRLLFEPKAPLLHRIFLVGATIYVVSPFDLIPEAILPPLGLAEDIVILLLAVHNLIRFTPSEVVKEHARTIAGLEDGNPE
ncbi:MAG: hypothetical protein CME26_05890 [Gemmatimonadetes bacterium]|nr:hypothetical protein [Gemmatimonadota bacterium]|tara:strand:- start:1154 stop:1477 length:324 start_codon:yes stop_codon:yes gene_type:complete